MSSSTEGYTHIKKELGKAMAKFGFSKYKTATLYRITDGDVLQFINFQKGDQSLSHKMTINIVVQPLFSPGCSFQVLEPGLRIGQILPPYKDRWWLCESETSNESSLSELKNILVDNLMPFFDKTRDAKHLYETIHDDSFRYLWITQYSFIPKGYICLKEKRYQEALTIFEANRPSQVSKFKTIKNHIQNRQFAEINKILTDNVNYSREKLKI